MLNNARYYMLIIQEKIELSKYVLYTEPILQISEDLLDTNIFRKLMIYTLGFFLIAIHSTQD